LLYGKKVFASAGEETGTPKKKGPSRAERAIKKKKKSGRTFWLQLDFNKRVTSIRETKRILQGGSYLREIV